MKGVPLYHTCLGKGEPLLVLHGLLGLSDNWMTLAKRLSAHFYVIVPDLRNHGRSPHSPDFTYDAMVQDLVDLADQKGIKSLNVLGHSMGGRVAMMMAMKFPSLVAKGVVVDISPISLPTDDTHTNILNVMNQIELNEATSFSQVERLIRSYVHEDRIVQMCLKNVKRNTLQGFSWKPDVVTLLDQIDNLKQTIPADHSCLCPVLFIKGEQSPYIRIEEWPEILRIFPMATLVEVKNAGHWVHADAPEDLYKTVIGFL
jgi:esterase